MTMSLPTMRPSIGTVLVAAMLRDGVRSEGASVIVVGFSPGGIICTWLENSTGHRLGDEVTLPLSLFATEAREGVTRYIPKARAWSPSDPDHIPRGSRVIANGRAGVVLMREPVDGYQVQFNVPPSPGSEGATWVARVPRAAIVWPVAENVVPLRRGYSTAPPRERAKPATVTPLRARP